MEPDRKDATGTTDQRPGETSFDQQLSRYSREELLQWAYQMLLIRLFEEKTAEMYTRARIGGFVHLNIGEEATIVGAISTLRPTDYLYSNYREHGHALVKGVEPKRIMAELYGRATGTSSGRGGSMHLIDVERRFMGGYAIVGGSQPLAVGAGITVTYKGTDDIVMVIFGEGATNGGSFFESLNMAKLWRLPVVFLCVNNQYGMGTAVARASAVPEIYRKACAFDIASERVDGMDVLAVREVVSRAVARAREAKEPSLIEALTYRFRGHSMSDPQRYRTEEEVKVWRARDPIPAFRELLKKAGLATDADFERQQQEVARVVAEAVDFAEHSPAPGLDTLYQHVLVEDKGAC